jgi:3',5'-cyclic AMP phosphodiesterase CpdA
MPATRLPPLASASTTVDATLAPKHAALTTPDPNASADPSGLAKWMSAGYGVVVDGSGEPIMPLLPPGASTPPAAGPNARLLTRFAHIPDTQLADDESPTRLCQYDQPGETNAAFRPQEGDQCRVLDAAARTINALSAQAPISFVLTGGDNADSAQSNEVAWFMQILDGGRVQCDSGAVNDPVFGPDNDGKDPFIAAGLGMPWYWVTGNHDVLIQGIYPVDDTQRAVATGGVAATGTRDYSLPGAPVVTGEVPSDARRLPLHRDELMRQIAADSDGHGVGAAQVANGHAHYSFDAGDSLRFIVLDTSIETGNDAGIIRQGDLDGIIKPMLDQAKADGKWVVLASHHATGSITDGSGFGGTLQADAVPQATWLALLSTYDNILYYMVGHAHENRVRYIAPPTGHGFWEVMASALADYPHQFRLVEIWDDDNGWLRLRGVMVNYATDGDRVAFDGRELGVADGVSGWGKVGTGLATDRNVDLYVQKP